MSGTGKTKAAGPRERTASLGRLTALGVTEPWQAALLLPKGWGDFQAPISRFADEAFSDKAKVVVRGALHGEPSVRFDGTPRLTGYVADGAGNRIGFTEFGDTRAFRAALPAPGGTVLLSLRS